MDFKLTVKGQEALALAIRKAASDGNPRVEPVHLLLALLDQADGTVRPLLEAVGADTNEVFRGAIALQRKLPQAHDATAPGISRDLLSAIDTAARLSAEMRDDYISTEHLLVGLATGDHPVAARLQRAGAAPGALVGTFSRVRGRTRLASHDAQSGYQALEAYGTDLTRLAEEGKLDPVIGRDAEIRRAILVLAGLTRNNLVLIGEPGVGKTAVAEGLAQRIVDDDVPGSLRGKRLIMLDFAAMAAGPVSRSEFEQRVADVLDEIKASGGQILVLFKELHTAIGTGAAEGATGVGGMLKPMLARGELQIIGATTPGEYRERIEQDPALERHFQQVRVNELSVEDAIAILRGVKGRHEAYHQVQISDAALMAAAILSDRYITGRFLPDKAIDLVDEAASRLRMEIDSGPIELDEMRRAVDRMKREEVALSRESDAASKARLARLRADLADRLAQLAVLTARWEREKFELNRIVTIMRKLDDVKGRAEQAQRDGDFEAASRLLYGEIPALEAEIRRAAASGPGHEDSEGAGPGWNPPLFHEEVGPVDVAEAVSERTGIPIGQLIDPETGELLTTDDERGPDFAAAAGPDQTTGRQTAAAGHASTPGRQTTSPKYVVNISGVVQGVVIGDGAVQHNDFPDPPGNQTGCHDADS